MASKINQLCDLFKVRIGSAIMLCAVAGLATTPAGAISAGEGAVVALAVFLSAAAAGALNQYLERDLDGQMARTRGRPFVTGAFTPSAYWPTLIVLLLAGACAMAWLAGNLWSALFVFLGAFTYGVVYTVWLKRQTWWNIVWGGLAGSFAVLAGAAAADPAVAMVPLLLSVVLFLWTPPHFWSLAMALRRDYEAANVPMLPLVIGDRRAAWVILAHTVLLALLALVPLAYGMGWLYLAGAVAGGGLFVHRGIALVREPGAKAAMANFHASLLQLALLLLGAIADRWLWPTSVFG